MLTCPTCGAQNEATNKFCDQCGTRLDAVAAPAASAVTPVSPDQPTMAAANCPACGAGVLPGEAFCDNCGASLAAAAAPAAAAAAAAAAPVAVAVPVSAEAPVAAAPASATMNCAACGASVMVGEAFCDNCGASLPSSPPTEAAPVSPNDATLIAPPPPADPAPVAPNDATLIAPPPPADPAPVAPNDATLIAPPPPADPAPVAPNDATLIAPPPPADPAPVADPAPPADPAPVAPADPAPAPVVAGPDPAERARLESIVAANRQAVQMQEQMLALYPNGAPAFLSQALDAAKAELAKSEAELAAFDAQPVGPDPAEVARLEALVATNRQAVQMQEQMLTLYPNGAPAFLSQALDAAKAELAKSEAELAALVGAAPAPAAEPVPAPAAAPISAPVAEAAPAAPVAPPPPAPSAPRLVFADGGTELRLPEGKNEITVGREDPVSSIFPEVDLTAFGGEAGGVSRQHARLIKQGDTWYVVDLNSTNHTRVDGVRAEPNTNVAIKDGSKLQFGRVAATFHLS